MGIGNPSKYASFLIPQCYRSATAPGIHNSPLWWAPGSSILALIERPSKVQGTCRRQGKRKAASSILPMTGSVRQNRHFLVRWDSATMSWIRDLMILFLPSQARRLLINSLFILSSLSPCIHFTSMIRSSYFLVPLILPSPRCNSPSQKHENCYSPVLSMPGWCAGQHSTCEQIVETGRVMYRCWARNWGAAAGYAGVTRDGFYWQVSNCNL